MAWREFLPVRFGRPLSGKLDEAVTWANREAIPLLKQLRDVFQGMGDGDECDVVMLQGNDLQLEKPKSRVLHVVASGLTGGELDYRETNVYHLELDQSTALVITPPELAARDAANDVFGTSAHCVLRVTNAGGFNITSWSANVQHKSGTAPSLTSMTAGQKHFFSLYFDGTDQTVEVINSGPFG